jgi:hypothetical protein
MAEPYIICGPRGQKLYPSPREQPGKYRRRGQLPRDPKLAVSQADHAELVTLSAQLCSRVPLLRAAVRQKSEWAFAGDSWQPIYYGRHEDWGDTVTEWLVQQVYPNAIRASVRKDLMKAMQVSSMGWDIHGDDLAIYTTGPGNMPQMQIVPGTRIGNGDLSMNWWNPNVSGVSPEISGYGICMGGAFDGWKIYNGIIFNDDDEPVAARVLGWRRDGNKYVPTYQDVRIGFEYGTHLASEYEWHGIGRSLPRIAASVIPWMDKEEIDDLFHKGIKNAAVKNVIHKLGDGQDAVTARGDAIEAVAIPAEASSTGQEETIFVEYAEGGNTAYIGSHEQLQAFLYQQPHPNVEEFAVRRIRECLHDYGWLYELTDLASTGRSPTRLATELVNNSIWAKQSTGETRLFGFVKFAVAMGIRHKHIPAAPDGPLDEPYKWTFGLPKEMSVDAGNDVKASLERLRYGLTSQRIESARWGYVQKRIDRDREKEVKALLDRVARVRDFAREKNLNLPDQKILELFYMPSANSSATPAGSGGGGAERDDSPAQPAGAPPKSPAPKPNSSPNGAN